MPEALTATFLFTDIVGSTVLRDRLGDDAADEIGSQHDAIVDAALVANRGALVKRLGDGAMAVFASTGDAVGAGIAIQEQVALANRGVSPDARLEVRVGINAGEVAVGEGDYIGTPVAVASRVCDQAAGGQIIVTDIVQTLVGSRGGFTFAPLGPTSLKGLEEPVNLWQVLFADTTAPEATMDREFSFPPALTRAAATTIVGRSAAEEKVNAVFDQTASGDRRVAFVVGEPGVGKTAFTASWCRTAFDRGAVVLAGRSPVEAVTPYQPFVEIVRQVLVHRPALLGRLGPGTSSLARLLPDMAQMMPAAPKVTVDPSTERYLLFEAVVGLLRGVAAERPVVLLLDDLHWADAPSLAMLDHLVRHPDEAAILVVGTYRDTDLSRSHPLSRLLADLRRDRRTDRILLRGLDATGVGRLIESRLGRAAPEAVVRSLFEETEGNPFFVEEVLAHLRERGAVDAEGHWMDVGSVAEVGLPEGIREVVGARLDRLDLHTNRILLVAATIGREFDVELLQAVTDEDALTVETSLGDALSAGLLAEAGPGQFEFSHALIRQTLLEEMPTPRAARIHRAVAEALERADAPQSELAHHWAAAHDFERALPALISAASAAEEVSAFDDSREYLELAVELWVDVPNAAEFGAITHVDLLRRLAEMRNLLGDSAGAIDLGTVALSEVDRAADPVEAGAIMERLSRYHWVDGKGAAALEAGTAAVDIIPADPPTLERAKALAALAGLLMLSARYVASLEYADAAIDAARKADASDVEGHALTTRGTVMASLDEVDSGLESIRQGRKLSRDAGAIDDLLRSYANAGSILHRAGRYEEAIIEAQSAAELASEFGLASWMMAMRGNAAEALFDIGRWDESAALLTEDTTAGESVVASLMDISVRVRLAIGRGEYDMASRHLHRSAALVDRVVDPQFIGPYYVYAALLQQWLDQPLEALTWIRDGLKRIGGAEDLFYVDPLHQVGIAAVGDLAESGAASDEMVAEAEAWWAAMASRRSGYGEASARRATAHAELGRATGEDDPNRWRIATAAWDALGRPFEAAYARWRFCVAAGMADTSGEVSKALQAAAETARDLGAAPLLAKIEAAWSA